MIFLLFLGIPGYEYLLLVLLLSWAWAFPSVREFFSLVLPFLDSHGVVGSLVFDCIGFMNRSEVELDSL